MGSWLPIFASLLYIFAAGITNTNTNTNIYKQ